MTINFKNAYIKNTFTLLGRNEYNIKLTPDLLLNTYYTKKGSVECSEIDYQRLTWKKCTKRKRHKCFNKFRLTKPTHVF